MFPVSDTLRLRTFPFVNLALILANVAVFVYELTLDDVELFRFFLQRGVVPVEIVDWAKSPSGITEPSTAVTSMFIHGGWLHLLGNMVFLWVFGDNVEDAMGHLRYLLFYFLSGFGAVALQLYVDQEGVIPLVGASGAIAGVLGAYLVLYPRATVGVIVVWLWFLGALPVPAILLIGFWFILQLFNGIASLGVDAEVAGGVAFWAHVGGFLAGLLLALLLSRFSPQGRRSRLTRF
ncbi:MAG TPA: rhomboid family intramembrane serine protease [Dehalococcoidia bacterium]|nr:rhomboid family intramembrane serine protease [Dehalococcoidia bacterium]